MLNIFYRFKHNDLKKYRSSPHIDSQESTFSPTFPLLVKSFKLAATPLQDFLQKGLDVISLTLTSACRICLRVKWGAAALAHSQT